MELNETLGMNIQKGGASSLLTTEMRNYLDLAAYWARFLGIVGYVSSGLIAILSLFVMFMGNVFLPNGIGEAALGFGGMMFFAGLFYLGMAYFLFYIARATHQFGVKAKNTITNNSDEDLTLAFKNLKSLFRTHGIFTAIFVAVYGGILVIALIIGGGALLMR